LLKSLDSKGMKVFQVLAGVQLGLISLIIASAMQRMIIYQAEYGLTALRVYVFAFEIWLLGAIAWFAWTVLRDRREQLFGGILLWSFGFLVVMHVPNWEALIVRTNTARAIAGKPLDTSYLNQLSMDSVPALMSAQKHLPIETRETLARTLLYRQKMLDRLDWRSASFARIAAAHALRDQLQDLEADANAKTSIPKTDAPSRASNNFQDLWPGP
jgi:hypothetical protein